MFFTYCCPTFKLQNGDLENVVEDINVNLTCLIQTAAPLQLHALTREGADSQTHTNYLFILPKTQVRSLYALKL